MYMSVCENSYLFVYMNVDACVCMYTDMYVEMYNVCLLVYI